MGPLIIGGLIAGGVSGILSNSERIREQEKQERLLKLQEKNLRRKLYATSAILEGNMSIGAMQATNTAKGSAIDAYRSESAAEAGLGQSGIRGGTPYQALDKAIAEDRAALLEQASMIEKQFDVETMQGAMAINDIRDSLTMNDEQMDEINDRLGYLASPFAFMVSAATGAFAGGSVAANIQEMGVKLSGNAQWGEWPTKKQDIAPDVIPLIPLEQMPEVPSMSSGGSPLQFGGMNINNTAKIGTPFNLDLNSYDTPFSLSGKKSGLRFNS